MQEKSNFIQQLKKSFGGLQSEPLETLVSDNLISPFTVRLPKALLEEIRASIDALFRLRELPAYQQSYQHEVSQLGLKDPGNKSICMSYDFHVTADHHLKLIEVNTNAAFLALAVEMYKSKNQSPPVPDYSFSELRQNIETEFRLNGHSSSPQAAVIIDEHPEQQRLYLEFLVFRELFAQWGWNPQILDYRQVDPAKVDFIYNRFTDFFLNNPESAVLKKSFLERQNCFSPNPYEYFLLADKQRMIDWSTAGNLSKWGVRPEDEKIIQAVVPHCRSLDLDAKEELWQQRKNYFLKPKRAFGSKQSYKGSSVSRRVFDEIVGQDFIAQEYVPAPELVFPTPQGEQSFKYDLRCYAYQGRLQMIVARIYQGQVTNLRTPLGGFACVEFS